MGGDQLCTGVEQLFSGGAPALAGGGTHRLSGAQLAAADYREPVATTPGRHRHGGHVPGHAEAAVAGGSPGGLLLQPAVRATAMVRRRRIHLLHHPGNQCRPGQHHRPAVLLAGPAPGPVLRLSRLGVIRGSAGAVAADLPLEHGFSSHLGRLAHRLVCAAQLLARGRATKMVSLAGFAGGLLRNRLRPALVGTASAATHSVTGRAGHGAVLQPRATPALGHRAQLLQR